MSVLRDVIDEAVRSRLQDLQRLQRAGLVCLDGDFVPAVHYPAITAYPRTTADELFAGYAPPRDGLFDVYVHIPFCEKACVFCHYPVKLGERPAEKDGYLTALEREMDLTMARLGLATIKARSILVGGGTPTYLTPAQHERFLRAFTRRLDLAACTQFNYDVDPATIIGPDGARRLEVMRAHGVDRLTIGVQSLADDLLARMNRPHGVAQALESITAALAAGFKVNIEFIFGYPGQTMATWIETIEHAVRLGVGEIQLYRLKIIPYGDKTGRILARYAARAGDFVTLEQTMAMKQAAHCILEAHGYHENLSRVFSKAPQDFSHYADNQCCKLRDQLGFGLTAFSSLRDRFALNTLSFPEYYAAIAAGRLPLTRGLRRSREDQIRWSLILPLKNRDVHKPAYERRAGIALGRVFGPQIARLKAHGLVVEDETTLKLTPVGRFFADEVAQLFYRPGVIPFPREAYAAGELSPYADPDLHEVEA
ncbi:MAG TPA: coproporphyrinogen-III oxidase family protein [Polyangia bacterium]|jgi:oxygen-independent coproporphyrinogen-3 oxidase